MTYGKYSKDTSDVGISFVPRAELCRTIGYSCMGNPLSWQTSARGKLGLVVLVGLYASTTENWDFLVAITNRGGGGSDVQQMWVQIISNYTCHQITVMGLVILL